MALTVLMILLAQPREGEPAPFLRSWSVISLMAMASAVLGIALVISRIPAVQALQH